MNAICPGYVLTPLVERQIPDQARTHGVSEEDVVQNIMLASQPTKRFIAIDEVAALASLSRLRCGEIDHGCHAQHRRRLDRALIRNAKMQTAPAGAVLSCSRNDQAENDDPQPHVVCAFGFLITNCAPSRPSW